jgi:acylphosphatase
LAGWVRNLDDGAVEVCVKGPVARVDAFEKTLREGLEFPVRVEAIEVTELGDDFTAAGFRIRRD